MNRYKKGITTDSLYPVYYENDETVLRILRDYPMAKRVWMSIVNRKLQSNFFFLQKPLLGWLEENILKNPPTYSRKFWPLTFVTTCHFCWHTWNELVFEGKIPFGELIQHITGHANDYWLALEISNSTKKVVRMYEIRNVKWLPPPIGWCKINSDGLCDQRFSRMWRTN